MYAYIHEFSHLTPYFSHSTILLHALHNTTTTNPQILYTLQCVSMARSHMY